MPDSKKYNAWFIGGSVCVLGAWTALIVGTVTIAPLYKNQSPMPVDQATLGHGGAGLAGPLAEHLAQRFRKAPTFTHLRISQRTRRGLFAGRGEPNARVVLLRAGRALADARTNDNGEWQIATAIAKIAGRHNFALEQRGADGAYVAGESIQLHVPAAFRQTIDVTNSGARAGFQLVAVRTDREDIGSASSRKFDELIRDGRVERSGDARQRVVAELSDDILAPAWSWLRDANRSYHGEVVHRIKRGGGYDQGGDGNRERDTASRTADEPDRWRNSRDGRLSSVGRRQGTTWSGNGGAWVATGITGWLAAAQRGYSTEIVPRLSGRVPPVIVARAPDKDQVQETETETEAERQRRLERERDHQRSAAAKAEQERLEAARQRREAELRRQEAEEEARRLAEERRQSDLEEARKLAAESRRVLERRAEEKRLAIEAERRRAKDAEEQRRSERERELARAQDEAEKEALERQRRAEQEQENRAAGDAQRERKRLAELNLRTREQEREAAEQQRLEKQRRDRLIAEAAAIKRRQDEARLRARAESTRQEARLREERRLAEARRLEERRLEERRLEERRLAEARSLEKRSLEKRRLEEGRLEERRLAEARRLEARRLEESRLEESRQRRARAAALARAAARERLESAQRRRNQGSQPALPSQRPQRVAQQRLQDLKRFNRRDTEIEINVNRRSSDRTRSTENSDNQTRVEAQPKRRVGSSRRTTQTSRRTTKARRRELVRGYRRRLAKAGRSRCHRTAGRRINPPGTYTVKRGDSLWRISKRHYRLGRYFRMIQRANKRKIRRARLIYPCQRLHLPRRGRA